MAVTTFEVDERTADLIAHLRETFGVKTNAVLSKHGETQLSVRFPQAGRLLSASTAKPIASGCLSPIRSPYRMPACGDGWLSE